ncbi:MAG: sulfite exporter TauE/SafE family protein [Solirubrobacterales bacterium]
MDVALAILLALAGGAVGGLLGVGGGILFVPALAILLGNDQLEAEATSLLVIVPMAIVGTWRQHRHGNVDLREGALIGVLAVPGVVVGVVVANALPERALELGFAALCVIVAARLLKRALSEPEDGDGATVAE